MKQWSKKYSHINTHTLKLTSPLNISHPKGTFIFHPLNHPFSDATLVSGRVFLFCYFTPPRQWLLTTFFPIFLGQESHFVFLVLGFSSKTESPHLLLVAFCSPTQEMASLQPDVVSSNSVINAMAKSSQWQRAVQTNRYGEAGLLFVGDGVVTKTFRKECIEVNFILEDVVVNLNCELFNNNGCGSMCWGIQVSIMAGHYYPLLLHKCFGESFGMAISCPVLADGSVLANKADSPCIQC